MFERRRLLLLACAALTAGAGAVHAADPPKSTDPFLDDELLEFLGSADPTSDAVQPDDGSWIEYLSQTDIGTATRTGAPTVVAAKPNPPPQPPSPPGAKKDE